MNSDEKTNKSYREQIKSISLQSSIHGLPSILKTKYGATKLVWLACFLTSISYISYLLVELWLVYLQRNVLVTVRYSADHDLDFPAVMICDINDANRSLSSLVLSCSFNGEPCDMSYFGTTLSSTYGICHNFNNFMSGRPILKSVKSGNDFGLSVELFAGSSVRMPASNRRLGLAVAIYNASSRPSFAEETFFVAPGSETNFMFTRQIINKLSSPYSDCLVNNSDPFAYDSSEFRYTMSLSRIYRQNVCISFCATKHLNLSSVDNKTTKEAVFVLIKNATECVDKCPPDCHIVDFKIFSYFAHYPNHKYAMALRNRSSTVLSNLSIDEIRQSVLRLNVNYKNMNTISYDEMPVMSFETLLANVGGQLGLFLGMSVLSFFEILEIVFIIILEFLFKLKNNKISNSKTNFN